MNLIVWLMQFSDVIQCIVDYEDYTEKRQKKIQHVLIQHLKSLSLRRYQNVIELLLPCNLSAHISKKTVTKLSLSLSDTMRGKKKVFENTQYPKPHNVSFV